MYGTVSFMGDSILTGSQPIAARFAGLSLRCPVSGAGRGAGREAAICQAVVELLNENSYESVSMDAIASRAKASKATIYRRWSNKDQLVLHALRQFYGDSVVRVPDTGSLRQDLLQQLVGQLRDPQVFAANTAAVTALVHAAPRDAAFARDLRSMLESVQAGALGALLDRAHARGELSRRVDPALVFEVAQAQFCSRSGMESGAVDVDYVAHVVDDVLIPVIRHAGRRRRRRLHRRELIAVPAHRSVRGG